MKLCVIFLIDLYQKILSPILPPSCRFYPTCSSYCKQALDKHGLTKGLVMSVYRILRCSPLSLGGYDPVRKKNKKLWK